MEELYQNGDTGRAVEVLPFEPWLDSLFDRRNAFCLDRARLVINRLPFFNSQAEGHNHHLLFVEEGSFEARVEG
ncbi:MAG: hypothetical protein ACYTGH_20190, partial [Planctomycetota bacterium]